MNTKGLKVVSISALLAACLGSLHAEGGSKSGAFIGAEVGYGINFEHADSIPTNAQQQQSTTTTAAQYPYAALGLKVGYGHYFSQTFGLRGYASYHYGVNGMNSTNTEIEQGGGSGGGHTTTITKNTGLYSSHQVSANVEVVWDFLQLSQASFGVYAGVGVGYGALTANTTITEGGGAAATITEEQNLDSGLILPVNVGLEVGIGQHHRAGLNFRIPTIAASFKDNLGVNTTNQEYKNRNLIISVGYAYIF